HGPQRRTDSLACLSNLDQKRHGNSRSREMSMGVCNMAGRASRHLDAKQSKFRVQLWLVTPNFDPSGDGASFCPALIRARRARAGAHARLGPKRDLRRHLKPEAYNNEVVEGYTSQGWRRKVARLRPTAS